MTDLDDKLQSLLTAGLDFCEAGVNASAAVTPAATKSVLDELRNSRGTMLLQLELGAEHARVCLVAVDASGEPFARIFETTALPLSADMMN